MEKLTDYLLDTWYQGTQVFSNGFTKPKVRKGHFTENENGKLQRELFDYLLLNGFNRTSFQLVFSNEEVEQTAGLVKTNIEYPKGYNAHIRFYDDGIISCETEDTRSWINHWNSQEDGSKYLENIINESNIKNKDDIIPLIQYKCEEFHERLERNIETNSHYNKAISGLVIGTLSLPFIMGDSVQIFFAGPVIYGLTKNLFKSIKNKFNNS